MYGRANLDLLRRRLLLAACTTKAAGEPGVVQNAALTAAYIQRRGVREAVARRERSPEPGELLVRRLRSRCVAHVTERTLAGVWRCWRSRRNRRTWRVAWECEYKEASVTRAGTGAERRALSLHSLNAGASRVSVVTSPACRRSLSRRHRQEIVARRTTSSGRRLERVRLQVGAQQGAPGADGELELGTAPPCALGAEQVVSRVVGIEHTAGDQAVQRRGTLSP